MTNCAFAIVKVKYSTDAGTTGVGALTAQITNSIEKPGEAILDYMQNTRYGCAIPLSRIDTTSLTDLDTYSDVLIDYKPVGWSPGDPYSQQARYRVNGPLDTSQNCLENLQRLVDSCDSWLQYSELTGQWRVVINKLYDGYPDPSGLFLVDSSNLVGGIEISPIDLNETYNQIEVAYPNTNIKDQTDYQIIDLFTDYPSVLSYNEAVNRLNVTFPLVNNAVQAKYLAARRIFQSREDLVISFRTDFSGIQIEAGDVIRVTHEVYGWTDKLFRVNSVAEEKDPEGNLFAAIQAFEYNDTVYADDPVQDFVPAFNTGLLDPNVIDQPGTPTVALNPLGVNTVKSFKVTSTVPASGLVLYMDYNYGISSNVQEHRLYRTVQQSNGDPFTNSTSSNVDINDLPQGDYYFSTTARNNTAGRRSNASAQFNWNPSTPTPNVSNACNANSVGNVITSDAIPNLVIGANIYKLSGTGTLDPNTYVVGITSNSSPTIFTVTPNPTVALSNACLQAIDGGITPNTIVPNPNLTAATYRLPNVTIANTGLITDISNGGITIQDEGSSLSNTVTTLNFTGNGVTATVSNNIANISIIAGNGGGGTGTFRTVVATDTWALAFAPDHLYSGANANTSIANLLVGGSAFAYYIPGGYLLANNPNGIPTYQTYTFSTSDYYPSFQQTANSTLPNQFLATSYAGAANIFNPMGTFTLNTLPPTDSANSNNHGWYTAIAGTVGATYKGYSKIYQVDYSFQAVASSDITFQCGGKMNMIFPANNNSFGYVFYDTVQTVELSANRPKNITGSYIVYSGAGTGGNANYQVNTVGCAIKHWTSGVNLYLLNGTLTAYLIQ